MRLRGLRRAAIATPAEPSTVAATETASAPTPAAVAAIPAAATPDPTATPLVRGAAGAREKGENEAPGVQEAGGDRSKGDDQKVKGAMGTGLAAMNLAVPLPPPPPPPPPPLLVLSWTEGLAAIMTTRALMALMSMACK